MKKTFTLFMTILAVLLVGANSAATPIQSPTNCSVLAYVANRGGNSVSVIDTATNTVLTTITVGRGPYGVALSPNGARLYVTNNASSDVSVIDTLTNTVVATIPVPFPLSVAVSSDGKRVYVATQIAEPNDQVSVIDTSTNTVLTTVSVGKDPVAMEMTPDGSHLYVANMDSHNLSAIDLSNNTVSTMVAGLLFPNGLAIDPSGARAYVTTNAAFSNDVSVVDLLNNTVLTNVNVGGTPGAVVVDPMGTRAYVTVSEAAFGVRTHVSVIETATNTVLTAIALDASGNSIGINPAGTRVYVPNPFERTVSVIDTSTNTVLIRVPVGDTPFAIGNFIGTVCTPNPNDQIGSLITDISQSTSLPSGGPKTSLNAKLQTALQAIQADDVATACSSLQDFINELSAQKGKKIPADLADSLISSATQIENQLGCGP